MVVSSFPVRAGNRLISHSRTPTTDSCRLHFKNKRKSSETRWRLREVSGVRLRVRGGETEGHRSA